MDRFVSRESRLLDRPMGELRKREWLKVTQSAVRLVLQLVRPVIRRWSSSGYDLIGSSSSPAGGSPVRVAARRPGSRLAARSGNGPGRSPASKAPWGEAAERSVAEAKPAASLDIEGEPSRAAHGEGHGSGEDPGGAAARDSSA